MKKIIVSLPKNSEGKFKLSADKMKGKTFSSAGRLKKLIFSTTLASKLKEKTAIAIKADGSIVNESLPSKNREYLSKVLCVFLEDYLNPEAKYRKTVSPN